MMSHDNIQIYKLSASDIVRFAVMFNIDMWGVAIVVSVPWQVRRSLRSVVYASSRCSYSGYEVGEHGTN